MTEQVFYIVVGVLGTFIAFYGYKLFQVSLSLIGLMSGAIYGIVIMQLGYPEADVWPALLGGVLGGVVGFGAAFGLYRIGVFAAGGYLGFILGTNLVNSIEIQYPLVVVALLTALVGVITFTMQKRFLVWITSAYGAWHLVGAVFFFYDGREVLPYSFSFQDGFWLDQVDPKVLTAWGLVTVLAIIIQKTVTGRGLSKNAG